MERYYINFGTGAGNRYADSLEEAMEVADESASYTQRSITILDSDDNVVAVRGWCGCRDGIEEELDPIDFGDFGYYGDWSVY
jgi:hypothetical protein